MITRKLPPKKKEPAWYATLDLILSNYTPAASSADADEMHSTNDIIYAIDNHHGVPHSDVEIALVDGNDVVRIMTDKGYRAENTGHLQVRWLLKKK